MGSTNLHPVSPRIGAALRHRADEHGRVSFEQFMEIVLYHPEIGYYRRHITRIGRSASTDFFTSSSLGPIFGELVIACAVTQLGQRDPAAYRFVELGAEHGRGVLDGLDHPFAATAIVGAGDELDLAGDLIVFSNELFDAQPCARFLKTAEGWRERTVEITDQGIREGTRPVTADGDHLPEHVPVGYQLDLPRAARTLAHRIAGQPWQGLFLAIDYGKTWHELTRESPAGTVRAYCQHQQTNDLLARAGEQDLTCHICWDWMGEILSSQGFSVDPVLSQEAFLVKNAAMALASACAQEAGALSPRKASLLQLLHPSALGQKFQVMTAFREGL